MGWGRAFKQTLRAFGFGWREIGAGHALPATPDVHGQGGEGDQQQRKRSSPQHDGAGVQTRPVQHKVAVTRGHEIENLLRRLAFGELGANLLAQVDGQVGMRCGDRLVLANQTAEFFGYGQHARFQNRIGEGACGTTGIFENTKVESLKVYPNPAFDQLYIDNTEGVRRLEVTNMLGQKVKVVMVNSNTYTLSINGLDRGIYLISAFNDKGLVANNKFVKE